MATKKIEMEYNLRQLNNENNNAHQLWFPRAVSIILVVTWHDTDVTQPYSHLNCFSYASQSLFGDKWHLSLR